MPQIKLAMRQIVHTPSTNKQIKTGAINQSLTVGFGLQADNVTVKIHFSGEPADVLKLLKDFPLDPKLEKDVKVLCMLDSEYKSAPDVIAEKAAEGKKKAESVAKAQVGANPPPSLENLAPKLVDTIAK